MKMTAKAGVSHNHHISTLLKILFFLLATSWLAGPFVHGQHLGHLQFISDYEGLGQPWSWLFRASDLASSAVLIVLALYHRLKARDPWIFWVVVAYAVFSALDSFFPLDCRQSITTHCVSRNNFELLAHYAESTLTPLIGVILIIVNVIRHRRQRFANDIFLILQIVLGFLYFIGVLSGQAAVISQYIYQVAIALWLVYFFEAYEPAMLKPASKVYDWYRNGLAVWVGLAGVLEIFVAAAHLHLYGRGFALYFGASSAWLAKQGVIVGVLLLYLARQIQRGERRAAYALIVLFSSELFTYTLLSPHRPLAVIYELSILALFLSRKIFDRNSEPINLSRRVADLLSLIGGIIIALILVVITLAAVGRLGRAENILDGSEHFTSHIYNNGHRYVSHHDRLSDTLDVLAWSTVAIGVWALFRPRSLVKSTSQREREKARTLIEKYAGSSEDYFKLWPHDKSYFFAENGEGVIAYKLVRGTAFALADPIASSTGARQKLLADFINHCHQKGWTICFLPVEEEHKKLYKLSDFKLLAIGSSALVDVAKFNSKTRRDKWWRWKLNRATKAGLTYEISTPPHNRDLLAAAKSVSDAWLTSGGRREQGFAEGYFDEDYLDRCRLHLVRDDSGQVIAFLNELPVFVESRTTIDLIRLVPGQDAAMPFLLASMIERLANEGKFAKLDLGFVPLAQLDNRAAKLAKAAGKIRFSAVGLEQFKNKFDPDWQTTYMAYSGDIVDLAALALKLEAAMKQP